MINYSQNLEKTGNRKGQNMTTSKVAGGSFLVTESSTNTIFIPEYFNEDHKLIAKTALDFCEKEVAPNDGKFEAKQFDVMRELIKSFADLGLLQADVPEEYGGQHLGKVISALVIEKSARSSYFLTTITDHTGIGSLPLQLFGNTEQKKRYLTKLASGEMIGAYALTESQAGSDASAMKATAVLSPDGKNYILNGEKIWITNAGFADLFIVFGKIGGKITAFLIPRNSPGFNVGPEEHKLGIRGSSTCPLSFENTPVPVENVLGNIGEGFKIAMNVLNLGRFKLGAACLGGSKIILGVTRKYAKNRIAFGKPISDFGLIKNKFGKMLTSAWLMEAMIYRTADLLDKALANIDPEDTKSAMSAVAEYAAECSIVKVYCSEVMDDIADECLQIHGGMGYYEGDPNEVSPARCYRDSRINRIFEGTNEINRMFITDRLIKSDKSFNGKLSLFELAQDLFLNLEYLGITSANNSLLKNEFNSVDNLKKLTVILLGACAEKYITSLREEQEILAGLANCAMAVYAAEGGLLRANQMLMKGYETKIEIAMARIGLYDASRSVATEAHAILSRLGGEGKAPEIQKHICRLTECFAPDIIGINRIVAEAYIDGTWNFL